MRNGAIKVAIGVDSTGFRQILCVAEGDKVDNSGWLGFLRWLKKRGQKGVRLLISDCCLGLIEALSELYPQSHWMRCIVHMYQNGFSVVPSKMDPEVAAMFKAIHRRIALFPLRKPGQW